MKSMLSPMDQKLALASVDDEPITAEEAAAIEAGVASVNRKGGISMEELLADFGLTMSDFYTMGETPVSAEIPTE